MATNSDSDAIMYKDPNLLMMESGFVVIMGIGIFLIRRIV